MHTFAEAPPGSRMAPCAAYGCSYAEHMSQAVLDQFTADYAQFLDVEEIVAAQGELADDDRADLKAKIAIAVEPMLDLFTELQGALDEFDAQLVLRAAQGAAESMPARIRGAVTAVIASMDSDFEQLEEIGLEGDDYDVLMKTQQIIEDYRQETSLLRRRELIDELASDLRNAEVI